MVEELEKFNPKAICPKCKCDNIHTKFCRYSSIIKMKDSFECVMRLGDQLKEHLHRICGRCEYTWQEACLDG